MVEHGLNEASEGTWSQRQAPEGWNAAEKHVARNYFSRLINCPPGNI
jgi:hypothetical protein